MFRRIALVILTVILAGIFASTIGASNATGLAPAKKTWWRSTAYNYYGVTVPVYGCPSSSCTITNEIANYSKVNMLYWTDCHWYNGNYASNRWFYVEFWYGEWWVGWIHSSYVYQKERTWNWYWYC